MTMIISGERRRAAARSSGKLFRRKLRNPLWEGRGV
jgi:hypothetical protein